MPSRPFKPYMGKNTFGVLKEPQDAGQYILNKTASTSFCAPNVCVPSRTITSQSSRLILRRANKIYFSRCQDPYNTANLNINLVTKLNLRDVSVIQQNDPYAVPTYLDVTSIPYLDYTIDPSGSLFGNTICGTNNFQNYLRPNIQLPFYIINGNYETTSSDTYNTIITFYSDSTIRFFKSVSVNYVVVGGGGGGGSGYVGAAGGGGSGGGGGGIIENSALFENLYTINVGIGGPGASSVNPGTSGKNGADSSIIGNSTSFVVIGGHGGQSNYTGGISGTPGSIGGTSVTPAYLGGGGAGGGFTASGFNGSVNKDFGDIKIGGSYLKKIRSFQARIFRYDAVDMLNEITNNTDRYTADFDLAGGYASYDKTWGKIKLNGGLRTEYNLFNVSTSDFSGQKVNVDRNYLDFLPSVNLSYNLDKTKLRFSASKTLARPEFREVANFAYYDFVRNAQLLGNPNLEKSDIYNLDLKWEYYPKSGENISFALFGKNFIKPIEQIVADGSVPSNLLLTYTNPNKAQVFGVEFELRKKISSWLDAYTNTTLVNSEVNVRGVKRQLQGQSNYVINGGLNFHKGKNTINLSYNRVGDRISAVGFQGYPDIFENSRDVLDFVYLRKIEKGEIKFSVGDIFAQPSKFYQKINNRDLIKTNNEQMVSLSLNLNL